MHLADNVAIKFTTKGYGLQVNAIELIHTGNQHVINH